MSQLKNYLTKEELKFLENNRSLIDSGNIDSLDTLLKTKLGRHSRERILLALLYVGGFDYLKPVTVSSGNFSETTLYLGKGGDEIILLKLAHGLEVKAKDRIELYLRIDLGLVEAWVEVFLSRLGLAKEVIPTVKAKLPDIPDGDNLKPSAYLKHLSDLVKSFSNSFSLPVETEELFNSLKNLY
jgi:hypothetical protein